VPQAPFGEVFLCWVVDKFFVCFWVFDRVWEVGEGLILLGFGVVLGEFSIGVFHTLWITFFCFYFCLCHTK
jgi:hypothetical protein